MNCNRTHDPPCLELPLPDHGLAPEAWATLIAEELERLCRQFRWRYHLHGALPALYGWQTDIGGFFLHATHGRDCDDREVLRIYPMTTCQPHAYSVAALLFAAEVGVVARRLALDLDGYGAHHIAPERDRCIAALNILEIKAATFEWRLPLPATNNM